MSDPRSRAEGATAPARRPWHRGALVALAGAAAVGLAAAGALHAPAVTVSGPSVATTPRAGDDGSLGTTELACPGAPFLGTPGVPDLPSEGRLVTATPPRADLAALDVPVPPTGRLVTGVVGLRGTNRSDAARSVDGTGRPAAVVGTGAAVVGPVAGTVAVVDRPRARGLLSSGCGAPSADAWLIGGGDAPGRQERLLLTNLGANPATVEVEALRTAGVDGATSRTVTVPGRSRRGLFVDGGFGADAVPVLHVRASGGLVRATLVESWRDGTRTAGAEAIDPTAAPATTQVIAAVPAGRRTVRIGNPGASDAVVRLRTADARGEHPVAGGVVTVPAGSSAEEELPVATAPGSVVVRSDRPVVAAVATIPAGAGEASDLAWSVASDPVGRLGGTAVPAPVGGRRAIVVHASGSAARVRVTSVVGGRSVVRTVDVVADGTRIVGVPDGAGSTWVRPVTEGADVRAGLLAARGRGIAELRAASTVPSVRLRRGAVQVTPAG